MIDVIEFGGITAQVVRKSIKHVHLSVCPPTGAVRISAPHRVELESIRLFAASRLDWIRATKGDFWPKNGKRRVNICRAKAIMCGGGVAC